MLHRRRHKTPGPPSLEAGTAWGGRWAAHDSSLPIPPPPHTHSAHTLIKCPELSPLHQRPLRERL